MYNINMNELMQAIPFLVVATVIGAIVAFIKGSR